jgi:hypothetical protein
MPYHEEVELILNELSHWSMWQSFFGLATSQNILCVGYFWPSLIKDCVEAVKKCHLCQIFSQKMRAHPSPMFSCHCCWSFHQVGIDFTTCHPFSARGHHYIIVAVDYFMNWVKSMPTFNNDGETTVFFIFNQIVARFIMPKEIFTDHGSHFQNKMMTDLKSKLGFRKEHSSPYYP